MPRRSKLDPFLLQAALEGLQLQQERLSQQIAQVRTLLARSAAPTVEASAAPAKRTRSLATRRRMAAAQRRRWAEFRRLQQEPTPPAGAKRALKTAAPTHAPGKKAARR